MPGLLTMLIDGPGHYQPNRVIITSCTALQCMFSRYQLLLVLLCCPPSKLCPSHCYA